MPAPRLARRVTPAAIAGTLHLLIATLIVLMLPSAPTPTDDEEPVAPATVRVVLPPDLLFLSNETQGGGGGGGGNRQPEPIRRAESVGHDAVTMRTERKPPEMADRTVCAPGRLAGQPVDVLVTVVMDFSIR